MQQINLNVFPKDGHYHQEVDGTIIRAGNWSGVIARVVAYRKRNGLAPGNPKDEVRQQACVRSPDACREDANPEYDMALKKTNLKGRILAWAAALRARKPLPFVDEALMGARANVCAGCPSHSAVAGGCGSCKKAIKAVRDDILEGRPVDGRMAGCAELGEDTGISTWLAEPTVPNGTLPPCCWRRQSAP